MAEYLTVTIRANDGAKQVLVARDLAELTRTIRKSMVPSNHMIYVELDGLRSRRWDRERVVDSNIWTEVNPRAAHTRGPISQTTRDATP